MGEQSVVASNETRGPAPAAAVSPYRSSGTRAKWAMVLVGLATADIVIFAYLVFEGFKYWHADGSVDATAAVDWSLTLAPAQQQYTLLLILGAIGLLAWLSRVVDNIPALGGGKPTSSPAGAILWWFVPIAFLFRPYQIVADAFRRLAGNPAETNTRLVLVWWVWWVAGAVVARAAALLPYDTVDEVRTGIALLTGGLALLAAAGVTLLRIIWLTEQRASSRAASQSASLALPSQVDAAVRVAPQVSTAVSSREAPTEGASTSSSSGRTSPGSVVFCPSCGAPRLAHADFCGSCGAEFGRFEQA